MKMKVLPIVLVFMLLITSFAHANVVSTSTVTMLMDGKNVNFNVVQLKLNNKTIATDVPPVIHNNRTLVPLRAIMENLAADVTWNGEKQQVLVKTTDKEITLNINSALALVNGKQKALPDNVPAKLINNRTMVPIRFLAEEIGLDVNWDEKTRTVSLNDKVNVGEPIEEETEANILRGAVVDKKPLPEIRISLNSKAEYKETKLVTPDRLVLDLQNTKLQLDDPTKLSVDSMLRLPVSQGGIKEVRVAQTPDPLVTRVVIEFTTIMEHKITYDEKTNEMVITFVNYVNNVKADIFNTKEVVVIEGNNVSNYNVLELENPRRLVVDVLDAQSSSPNSYRINVEGRAASHIVVAQFQPDFNYKPDDKIVRVVIHLQDGTSFDDYFIETKDNQLWVHMEGKPYEAMNYISTGWTTSQLIFKAINATRYQVNRSANSNILEVVVPKDNLPLEFTNVEINDHMINKIIVADADSQNYNISIELKDEVEYKVIDGANTKELVLELKTKNQYREILVVLDPGHGGNQPGATSPNLKIVEKELALDVANRLNALLLEAGFRTYMTRTDDTRVELADRAGVANQLGADLFISIHANAATNPAINGIETFYYPSDKNPEDNRDNKTLANIFQNTMVSMLGANSRRVVAEPGFVVTRNTTMPAILSEMGFLTNPQEEAKLATSEYRQKVAESMFAATVKYFDEINKR